MSNLRKVINASAVAILGATNLLSPLSYVNAVTGYGSLTSNDFESPALSFIMPDYDISLYAITAANHFFVEYSGTTKTSGEMPNSEFIYDQPNQHLSGNTYAKTGYSFSGWKNGSGVDFEDGALVGNWTTVESGTVPIYAQWNPNRYYITYDLNDNDGGTSSGVHSQTPTSGLYDETLTIEHPSRTGYVFSGWYITAMDTETHMISGAEYHGTTDDHEMATSYANLHANSGTVNFMARWDKGVVNYLVEHFKETFTENDYSIKMTGDTVNGTGLADDTINPEVKTYEGFTSPATVTTGIKADGSTYVKYDYDRNSYHLELIAGRGIDSVTATGEHNTVGVTTDSTASADFKYEDQVELSFVLSDGYENAQWSGSNNNDSSFTMPAENISKTAYATPIIYNITYDENGGTHSHEPATYTIESSGFDLVAPTGIHSTFLGWTGGVNGGEQLSGTTLNVRIDQGSTGHRSYTAVWRCDAGYHAQNSDSTGDINYGNCVANEDTPYKVEHYFQNVEGTDYAYSGAEDEYKLGVTDTETTETGNVYPGFVVNYVDQTIINGNGTGVAKVYYDRLSYSGNITKDTGVETATGVGVYSPEGGPYKYEDTVTLTATTGAGYIFDGWTVTDENSVPVTVTNASGLIASFEMPVGVVAIHAAAHADTYTITYHLNSGTVAGINPEEYTVETPDITLIDPTRDHSVFLGWTGTDRSELFSGTVAVSKGSVGDREFVANWGCVPGYHADGNSCVANEYHIVVPNMNGTGHGGPDNINFTYDQTGYLPEEPSQSGYDFVGWSITGMSGGVEHYIGDVVVTDDTYVYSGTSIEFKNLTVESGGVVTLTALWSPRNDTDYVIYHYYRDINGTTYSLSGTDNLTGTTDTDVVFAEKLQNYEGFTYTGGFVNITSTPTAGLPDEPKVATGNIEKDGSLEIYLYYDRHIHTVTLSGDEHIASLSWTGDKLFDYGANVTVEAVAKTGYHFVRWEATPDPATL